MSSCCEQPECAVRTAPAVCPASGTKGVPVGLQTVKALLTSAALQRVEPGAYRFCTDQACEVVYFDDRGHTFSEADLRARVWQKQAEGDRVLCYCFGENESDIRAEIALCGYSRAAERVRAHIKAGRCACKIRNPRGTCCLGDVTTAVKQLGAAPAPARAEGGS